MSSLTEMGCSVQYAKKSSSTSLNGIEISSNETTELKITLPKKASVQATFSKEGMAKKLVKLFKKELQTGDPHFDRLIYIATDTPEATSALLASEDLRMLIIDVVNMGGPIEIEESKVTMSVAGHTESEPREAVTLVKAILG